MQDVTDTHAHLKFAAMCTVISGLVRKPGEGMVLYSATSGAMGINPNVYSGSLGHTTLYMALRCLLSAECTLMLTLTVDAEHVNKSLRHCSNSCMGLQLLKRRAKLGGKARTLKGSLLHDRRICSLRDAVRRTSVLKMSFPAAESDRR